MVEKQNEHVLEDTAEPTLGGFDLASDERVIYELGYHLISTLSNEEILKENSLIKELVEENKGTFLAEDMPKLTHLAYTMGKKQEGKNVQYDTAYFGWMKFEMSPGEATLFNQAIKTLPNMLRYIMVKATADVAFMPRKAAYARPEEKGPSPLRRDFTRGPKEKIGTKVSDEELDKSIEELVGT